MDQSAFDRINALFAAKAARRAAIASAAGAAGAAALGSLQDAEATRRKGKAGAAKKKGRKPKQEEKTMFLFLQTSQGGTLADNGDGTYDLVLEGHHGGTIYFSDRPQRVFGVSPTDTFLDGLGFPADNPPNAALLVNAGDVEDVAIVELFDPSYDEASGRLTYRVKILAAYDENGLDHIAEQIDDSELPTAFAQAALFIDDCQSYTKCCQPFGSNLYNCQPTDFGRLRTDSCYLPYDSGLNDGWRRCTGCQEGQKDALDAVCRNTLGYTYRAY